MRLTHRKSNKSFADEGFFAPVHLYVGFLRVWLSYAFLPISLGWWLMGGLAHTIGSWEYGFLVFMFDCLPTGRGYLFVP